MVRKTVSKYAPQVDWMLCIATLIAVRNTSMRGSIICQRSVRKSALSRHSLGSFFFQSEQARVPLGAPVKCRRGQRSDNLLFALYIHVRKPKALPQHRLSAHSWLLFARRSEVLTSVALSLCLSIGSKRVPRLSSHLPNHEQCTARSGEHSHGGTHHCRLNFGRQSVPERAEPISHSRNLILD